MRTPGPPFALLIALSLCACSQRVYSVGTSNPERPAMEAGAALHVTKDPSDAASEFDESVGRKLARLTQERGYRVTTAQDADYVLYYGFRSHAMMSNMSLELKQGTTIGMETAHRGGPYVQSLRLYVVDAPTRSEPSAGRAIVWEGGAVLTGATQSIKFQDLLIVAAVKQLGRTTDDTVVTKMRLNDKSAKHLRR